MIYNAVLSLSHIPTGPVSSRWTLWLSYCGGIGEIVGWGPVNDGWDWTVHPVRRAA